MSAGHPAFREAPRCLICGGGAMRPHSYPPNRFHGVQYDYFRCLDCDSISISPLPAKEAMDRLYGEEDHLYLREVAEGGAFVPSTRRGDYREHTADRFQIDSLEEDLPLFEGKRLLDVGCGGGFYIANARAFGLEAAGIEYDRAFAELLRRKTALPIFAFEEMRDAPVPRTFDIIHFGHILEHLPAPSDFIERIRVEFGHPGTLFVVDGPLENNRCLSRWVIDWGSRIKGRPYNEFAPHHLSFTNYESQLRFFETAGLKRVRYVTSEQYWPLPERPDWSSPGLLGRFALAKVSMALSWLFETHGNLFHYVGRF